MKAKKNFCVLIMFLVAFFSSNISQSAHSQNSQSSFDELLNIIHTGNAYQRANAIIALSRINDERVVPELMNLLKDEDSRVRINATIELARLADKRSADALADAE